MAGSSGGSTEAFFRQPHTAADLLERADKAYLRPLNKNIKFDEVIKTGRYFDLPNYVRQPLWRSFVEGQFNARNFLFLGKSWAVLPALLLCLTLGSRLFAPPPESRLDKYWLNSPKFRILTAFHNIGRRPAFRVTCATYQVRYFGRGLDHPFVGVNEWKDHLYKLREQLVIEQHPTIQAPYVHRQYNRVETPDDFHVALQPLPNPGAH